MDYNLCIFGSAYLPAGFDDFRFRLFEPGFHHRLRDRQSNLACVAGLLHEDAHAGDAHCKGVGVLFFGNRFDQFHFAFVHVRVAIFSFFEDFLEVLVGLRLGKRRRKLIN